MQKPTLTIPSTIKTALITSPVIRPRLVYFSVTNVGKIKATAKPSHAKTLLNEVMALLMRWRWFDSLLLLMMIKSPSVLSWMLGFCMLSGMFQSLKLNYSSACG